jgi:predicted nucleic acid-binding protein
MKGDRAFLLMDANVLIDFCKSDASVLALVSSEIGTVHIPRPLLEEEVEKLHHQDWTALGVVAVEPSLAMAAAAAVRRPGLSFHDVLCLLVAKEHGWTCVTNDVRLRRECRSERVPVLWGLELLLMLAERGVLSREVAWSIGNAIHEANPFITAKVLAEFRKRLRR